MRVKLLTAFILILMLSPLMQYLDKHKPSYSVAGNVPKYSYSMLRIFFPCLRGSIADAIYMQLCYIAGSDVFKQYKEAKLTRRDFDTVIDDVNTITKLDPYYFDPYYFLAGYVSWKVGRCPESIEKLNRILIRGKRYINTWQMPFFIGFNYFYFLKDKARAAYYMKLAANMKGSPYYLKLLVPRIYLESGDIELAIAVVREELKLTKNDLVRKLLKKRLKALNIMYSLDQALLSYRKRFKSCPHSLSELVERNVIPELPRDPYGGRFYIRKDCTVWTTSNLRPAH